MRRLSVPLIVLACLGVTGCGLTIKIPPFPQPSPSATAPVPSASPSASPSPLPTPTPEPTPTPNPPSPSPSPSPTATPTPTVPPIGPDGNYPLPAKGTVPPWFDVPPVRVNLGDAPNQPRIDRGRAIFVFNAKPVSEEPLCPHRPDGDPNKKGECEQWAPAAETQDRVYGEGPMWWFGAYPGTACNRLSWTERDCQVEHPSRPCDATEKAEDERNGLDPGKCARPDAFHGRDVVDPSGGNGGPPGRREICVAPHKRPEKRVCRSWDLQADGRWRLIE